MGKYWFPYLVLMANLLSGAIWILLINRRGKFGSPGQQWLKYGIYLGVVNLVWWIIAWLEPGASWIGFVILAGSLAEWWKLIRDRRIFWIPSLMLAMLLLGFWRFLTLDRSMVLLTYFVVVLFDGSCQVAGQLFGKRLLFPGISPRKTAEGLAGGLLITLSFSVLTASAFSITPVRMGWITLLTMAFAFTGDLLASIMKRRAGIDSFSRLIPGHGGILDRFDSWISAGAFWYVLSMVMEINLV